MRWLFIISGLIGIISISLTERQYNFKIIGGNERFDVIAVGGKLDISEFEIKNISDKSLQLNWRTVDNSLPSSWDYSMCAYGECQIGIPKGAKLKVIEPNKKGFIALHVFPKNNNPSKRTSPNT